MIRINHIGNFNRLEHFLEIATNPTGMYATISKYGQIGVDRLKAATPVDTGKTRDSWSYEIEAIKKGVYVLRFVNNNVIDGTGTNVAILIDKGHGTKNGSYVAGKHFINPITKELFNALADELWREVNSV